MSRMPSNLIRGHPAAASTARAAIRAALVLAVLAILGGPVRAGDRLAGPIPADVIRIMDGDTLAVRAHIWLGQTVEVHVRLSGIDTPELRGACPAERRAALQARDTLTRLTRAGTVTLEDLRADKYGGRVLARVRGSDGRDLAADMLAEGLAASYAGGRRGDWCERLAHRNTASSP
jgi:endonuclease YncB( thermonuclease family)